MKCLLKVYFNERATEESVQEVVNLLNMQSVVHKVMIDKRGDKDEASETFWKTMQFLFDKNLIQEEKHFIIRDNYIFIKLKNIFPLYETEQFVRGLIPYSKTQLAYCLSSNTSGFIGKKNVRFADGMQHKCLQFQYHFLNINFLKKKETINYQLEQFQSMVDRISKNFK